MTSFIIKIIACITMVLDHIKYAIPQTDCFITEYLGRLSYPLFAFLVVEGYVHTSDLKKYYKRLLIFAIISQIPFMLFRTLVGQWKMLNIMFTLLLGLLCITVYDKIKKEYISFPICIVLILLGEFLNVDYGWFGVAIIFILYVFKEKNILKLIAYTILIIIYFYFIGIKVINNTVVMLFISMLLPIIIILAYNGKQGKKMKYFFYWFYPIHMIILYALSFMQNGTF